MRLLPALAVSLLSLTALAGCSPDGSAQPAPPISSSVSAGGEIAAVVGSVSIPEQTVRDQAAEVRQRAPGTPTDGTLEADVLQRLVIGELVRQAAASKGVSVTDDEVATANALAAQQQGGLDQLLDSFAEVGVPPSAAASQIRVSLLTEKLGQDLDPSGDPQAQQAAVARLISQMSSELGVRVAPAYGTWDIGESQLVAAPGTP